MVPGWQLEQILVLALASNRLARAVTVDEITPAAREAAAEEDSGARRVMRSA